MAKRRISYSTKQKLEVIMFAEECKNNSEAARKFNVGETNVRRWLKEKNVLMKLNPMKRSLRKGKPKWIKLEEKLKNWILDLRKQKYQVSTVNIRFKAQDLAKEGGLTDFKGTKNWVNKFMKRNRLSVKRSTTQGQRLPDDWEVQIEKFLLFVNEKKSGIDFAQIGNMDEVPCSFDIPRNRTVEEVGKEDVGIVTTGHEKMNFTVILTATADGGKCKPMVIFKRKTMPKEKFPEGIVVAVNPKGWMNVEMMKFWLENVWQKRRGSFFKPKSLLIYESARAHLTEEVKKEVTKQSQLAVIPGGLTKKVQPLDLSSNKPFKDNMKNHWDAWMKEGVHEFTKSKKMKRASYSTVCHWIVQSWKNVSEETIKNGFKKSKICVYDLVDLHDKNKQVNDCDENSDDTEIECDEVNDDDTEIEECDKDDSQDTEMSNDEVDNDFDEENYDQIDQLDKDLNEKCTIEFIDDEEFNGFE